MKRTLGHLRRLWGRRVVLGTRVGDDDVQLSFDEDERFQSTPLSKAPSREMT